LLDAADMRDQWIVGGTLPGDANLDGLVNEQDLARLIAKMNQPGSFGDGDFDQNGFVDQADMNLYQANYGRRMASFTLTPGANLALDSAPEPGAVGLFAFVAGGALMRRARRRV
jgi:hypothetical protein